jgi:hypothetical protein
VVLTVQTTEVATGAGDGETFRSRVEMIQGLLFYRIDSERTGPAIHLAHECPGHIVAVTA